MKSNFDESVTVDNGDGTWTVKVQYDTDTRIFNDLSIAVPYFESDYLVTPLYDWSEYAGNENPPFDLLNQAREEMVNFLSDPGLGETVPDFLNERVGNRTTFMKQYINDVTIQTYIDEAIQAAAGGGGGGGK